MNKILLGLIMATNIAITTELKPSQLKSLENLLLKIQQSEEIINSQESTDDLYKIEARERELNKTQKGLDRLTKSLQRLPENSEVTNGVTQIEQLNETLKQKLAELDKLQNDLKLEASKAEMELETLLSSEQTQADIKLIENLSLIFMEAWHDSPANSTDNQWDAAVHTEIWNEKEVASLVYIMENWQSLLQEADDLITQYHDISKTREGLKALGTKLRDLQNFSQNFKESRLRIIAVLPRAIETTAKQYYDAYKKEYDNFIAADKVQDKSRMLIMGNPNSWYQTLRLRMKAQIMIYQAAGLADLQQMNQIQNEAKKYKDKVSRELLDWQQLQQGEELQELQRQQIKQNEEQRINDEKRALEKEQWIQRRIQIDEEREKRRLRLIELRKVEKK